MVILPPTDYLRFYPHNVPLLSLLSDFSFPPVKLTLSPLNYLSFSLRNSTETPTGLPRQLPSTPSSFNSPKSAPGRLPRPVSKPRKAHPGLSAAVAASVSPNGGEGQPSRF